MRKRWTGPGKIGTEEGIKKLNEEFNCSVDWLEQQPAFVRQHLESVPETEDSAAPTPPPPPDPSKDEEGTKEEEPGKDEEPPTAPETDKPSDKKNKGK